jgi:hypothetical protein
MIKNAAAIAASLLSRGAALDPSHGRKPVEDVGCGDKPRRGERVRGICRNYGADVPFLPETTGLRPWLGSNAAPRLLSDALRAPIWTP